MESKRYFCSEEGCGMRFEKPSRLLWHSRLHTGEKPFKCANEGCEKSYATTTKLKRHQKKCITQHEASPTRSVIERSDESTDFKYKCNATDCAATFKRRMHLYNHKILVHEKSTKYKCEHSGCEKAFAFPNLLKRHMKLHQGYTCSHCEKIVEKWTDLRAHISLYHRKVHQCEQCSKTFSRPCDLRRHETMHTGLKEVYRCPEEGCDKFYDRVTNLRKHIKAQHCRELPYTCNQCEATFPRKADAMKHKKSHSNKEKMKNYPNKAHRKISLVQRLLVPDESAVAKVSIASQHRQYGTEHTADTNSVKLTDVGENDDGMLSR